MHFRFWAKRVGRSPNELVKVSVYVAAHKSLSHQLTGQLTFTPPQYAEFKQIVTNLELGKPEVDFRE